MLQLLVIGIGAGLAAALLFASLVSGALISFVLFYLAPLPILIVALGWSHWCGLIATFVAAACLAFAFGDYFFLAFLLGIGLPAWWLSYLALLARPVATAAGETLEWYPVGRLVIWAAILSGLVICAFLLSLGHSEETVRAELRRGFEQILRRAGGPPGFPGGPDKLGRVESLVAIAPPAAAISVTFINLVMLWLAGHIVKMSNRLRRPWPDIAAMVFPPSAPVLLAAALVGAMLAAIIGLAGLMSGVFAASLVTGYGILGFAVLHSITRGMSARHTLLALAYVAVVLIWPILALIALLGLADSFFDFRGRIAGRRGPPTIRA